MKIAAVLCLLLSLELALSYFTITDLAKLNAVAYQPAASIRAWNCSLCKELSQVKIPLVFSRQGLQGYIGFQSNENAIFIALRGTENPFDVTKIVNEDPEPYPYCDFCFVNSAIYRAWDVLRDDIMINLQKAVSVFRQAKTIILMGHGLGGAIANLAIPEILKLYDDQKREIQMITFGQPRVGNIQFANYIGKLQYLQRIVFARIVHNADPIPHILELGFYYHALTQVWFEEQMEHSRSCYFDSVDGCSNTLTEYSNDDHLIQGYMKSRRS